MADDPYQGLAAGYDTRKRDYLRRTCSDEKTFLADPVANGTAQRRGYLRGDPNGYQVMSLADRDAAAAASRNHQAAWTDSPGVRAELGDPWDGDNVRSLILRLTHDPNFFVPPYNEPLPDPTRKDLPFREVLVLASRLGVTGRRDFRLKLRSLFGVARDLAVTAWDFRPEPTFPAELTERVLIDLDRPITPAAPDRSREPELVEMLSTRRPEQLPAKLTPEHAKHIVNGLYGLLSSDLVVALVTAAVTSGAPGQYVKPSRGGYEAPPSSYEKPPDTYEKPPNTYERPPGSDERPASTYEDPNPTVRPRDPDLMFGGVWILLDVLASFGEMHLGGVNVRSAVHSLAGWAWSGLPFAAVRHRKDDDSAVNLIHDLFGGVKTPPGFLWPPYTPVGVYYWRIIRHHCVDHCYNLKDTADFHTTALIRLLKLHEKRLPDYAVTDIRLALRWFKYWYDEPRSSTPDDPPNPTDDEEMTFWSENHAILFPQSELLAGAMMRHERFPRSGGITGQAHIDRAIPRVERWLDDRLRFGFSEWNAPGYYDEDFPPLLNLVDFVDPDDQAITSEQERAALRRIRTKAAMVVDQLVFDLARYTGRGSFGVTAGRAYFEHKNYGWEQSVGDCVELLFGTRGDLMSTNEPSAMSFATSRYRPPEALLAIGLDRLYADRQAPLVDRSRVSVTFDEAKEKYGIGTESEDDIAFWWSRGAFFDHTLEGTKRVVEAHPNLARTPPFNLLYTLDEWWKRLLISLIAVPLQAIKIAGSLAKGGLVPLLPPPFNIMLTKDAATDFIDGVVGLAKSFWDGVKSVWDAVTGIFGGDDDDEPEIPDSTIQEFLELLLVEFNRGSVLSRANLCTYSNGDALLSSVQNHLPGELAFQKHPWQATLGCDAAVWTTAQLTSPDMGSFVAGTGRFFSSLAGLRMEEAFFAHSAPTLLELFGPEEPFGHDGPNYWTGSLALPMIVQRENAAIIAYDIPSETRTVSGAKTHAWFPKAAFDETAARDAGDGTWFFGRKDTLHPVDRKRIGSGYVALFSGRRAAWAGEGTWKDKEIDPESGNNVFVCMVGNERTFGDFSTFQNEVAGAYLNVSGLGEGGPQVQCSFDVPRAVAATQPRLELFYDDRVGRFAGEDLSLDEHPRYSNRYGEVPWGSRSYTINHPLTGLTLHHDLDKPLRQATIQQPPGTKPAARRLVAGSLTPFRRIPDRTRP